VFPEKMTLPASAQAPALVALASSFQSHCGSSVTCMSGIERKGCVPR
jgi:hypothetical protein